MKRNHLAFTVKHKVASLLILTTLIWLTISFPFVYAAQQQIKQEKITTSSGPASHKEDDSNTPFTNTPEEEAPVNNNTISEEYLHDADFFTHQFTISISHKINADVATYIAFHGKLLSPPPEL